MSEKSTSVGLEEAVTKQAASLDPAQREFVYAQFAHYRWNEERIAEYERQLEEGLTYGDHDLRDYDAEKKVFDQRHKLIAEQGTLFSHIMRWLKGTTFEKGEFEKFLEEG